MGLSCRSDKVTRVAMSDPAQTKKPHLKRRRSERGEPVFDLGIRYLAIIGPKIHLCMMPNGLPGENPNSKWGDHEVYEARSSGKGAGSRLRRTRAGTPAAKTRSGMGLVPTAPAPMTESLPTSAMITAPLPIQVPA